ncbi:uncharacterized protein [Argopecten irradians]|uniref:uncharacterized protein n=1 Tax=Argopecten irradians TaxID=31199 RepID=UPI003719CF5D
MAAERKKQITNKEGRQVSTYNELLKVSYAEKDTARSYSRPSDGDKLWPITVEDSKNKKVRIHYIGWPRRYDEWRNREDLVELSVSTNTLCKQLAVQIKERLASTTTDSRIILRIAITDLEDFKSLQEHASVYKVTTHRIVYHIKKRQSLETPLGVGWDYRVINESGDNFYVKTETVKFWMYKRQPLKEYIIFPDHKVETAIDRGVCLTFTFVMCAGNNAFLCNLLNNDLL